jgi:hypothetical protein
MDHPDTYWTMGSLAIALGELGGFAEARGLVVQVLKWRKEPLGMDHPRTYEAMDNSTIPPSALHDFDDAKELTIRVLELQKTRLGMDLPTHIGRWAVWRPSESMVQQKRAEKWLASVSDWIIQTHKAMRIRWISVPRNSLGWIILDHG